ncbi:MAG: hypothetical protein DRJ44_07680 [Thermoprotei archaeon]|nr:MAG: hypothetical protein DRJ44_07680 [Thermoprotei archaeon]
MNTEIVVASGKGGTGKTFISSNFSYFLNKKGFNVLAVDADVEAPDLILALGDVKKILYEENFEGQVVDIDYSKCLRCGACVETCRFNALSMSDEGPVVDYNFCEGFGTCALVCPVQAIYLKPAKRGRIFAAISNTGIPVVTGDLDIGEKNSGLLVYRIRELAKEYSFKFNARLIVIDAAPGIGCPVISSLVGARLLVIVVEPTPQSLKGAMRLKELADKLNIQSLAVINKYNLNPSFTRTIVDALNVEILGKIGYDDKVVESYTLMKPILETYPESKISSNLETIFKRILERLSL